MIVKIKTLENPNGSIIDLAFKNSKRAELIIINYSSSRIVTENTRNAIRDIYCDLSQTEKQALHLFSFYNHKIYKLNLHTHDIRKITAFGHSLMDRIVYRSLFFNNNGINTKI